MAVFQKVEWSDEAGTLLKKAMPPAEMPWLESNVKSGRLGLYRYEKGFAVLGCDDDDLVIVAMSGRDMIDDVVRFTEALAYLNGFKKIRFHTKRPGFFKICPKHNFVFREYVFERFL